jgi:hypothetical protein
MTTLVCLDSAFPANLPAGADAYLGYVDGHWPDYDTEVKKFTSAHIIGLTVLYVDEGMGADIEAGALDPNQAGAYAQERIAAGVNRPILYSSISVIPLMEASVLEAGLTRDKVRLLSAHYGLGNHICGPATCQYFGKGTPDCDGTQWTDAAPGLKGTTIDQSALQTNFFDGEPVPPRPAPVPAGRRNIYTPVTEDGIFGSATCAAQQFVDFNGNIADVDGIFGPASKVAMQKYLAVQPSGVMDVITVRALQLRVGVKQDGMWGPVTTLGLQKALNAGLY